VIACGIDNDYREDGNTNVYLLRANRTKSRGRLLRDAVAELSHAFSLRNLILKIKH